MATIIVALDVPTREEALSIVDRIGDEVSFYKVGSQLFTRSGPDIVHALQDRGKSVFLDLKFHDIPTTVASAVAAATDLGVELLTLHASGGSAMLRAAREAAGPDGPGLLAVTLLTSFTASDIEEVWGKELRSVREEVARLSSLAVDAGLNGIVASALEAEAIKRKHGNDFLVVTPGIRPSGTDVRDQVRTATPAEAVSGGSDYLVVGRPVTQATEPQAVVAAMLEEITAALRANEE
jgi:orotidine-5'-phosphate decarboxylase